MRLFLLALALLSGGAMGCEKVSVTTTHEQRLGAAKRVDVSTNGGDITLIAGDEGRAYVEAERTAYDEDEARRLRVRVAVDGEVLRVWWEGSGDHGRSVSFRVWVPAGLPARLRTDGGDVSVEAMRAGVEALSDGGNVRCQDSEGLLYARTDGGDIRVRRHVGTVDLETDGGDVAVSGALEGENVAQSDGGDVEVTLAGESRLFVSASSDGGSVSNDFGLPTSERSGHEGFEGAIGDGSEGSLLLRTDGGRVRLRRAP
ncbi:MAG: DUF4097 domain-containing protein [Polyangiaceae bacterium]|nr:DUF4097 domain-containing protein [Polyangiaceae bacterium]